MSDKPIRVPRLIASHYLSVDPIVNVLLAIEGRNTDEPTVNVIKVASNVIGVGKIIGWSAHIPDARTWEWNFFCEGGHIIRMEATAAALHLATLETYRLSYTIDGMDYSTDPETRHNVTSS